MESQRDFSAVWPNVLSGILSMLCLNGCVGDSISDEPCVELWCEDSSMLLLQRRPEALIWADGKIISYDYVNDRYLAGEKSRSVAESLMCSLRDKGFMSLTNDLGYVAAEWTGNTIIARLPGMTNCVTFSGPYPQYLAKPDARLSKFIAVWTDVITLIRGTADVSMEKGVREISHDQLPKAYR